MLTQAAPGMDLKAYLDFSAANLGGLELIDDAIVNGDSGRDLGVLEYNGVVPGADRPLHFLALIAVADERAIVVTLSTEEDDFARLRRSVEPYMRTVRPT